jgi:hypothetical protein
MKKTPPLKPTLRHFLIFTASITIMGLVIFNTALRENMTMFSNDAPLGIRMADHNQIENNITGHWENLNWVGGKGISGSVNLSSLWAYICGPLWFSKLYPLIAFITLGCCTWYCMREISFRPWICFIVGVASALNGSAFSVSCWGLAPWAMSRAMIFLAIGFLYSIKNKV